MRTVKIYTTPWCGFCHRAKRLLEQHGVPFDEIAVDGDREARVWLRKASGQRTVPQIFFDEESIGGCSELEVLIANQHLAEKLAN